MTSKFQTQVFPHEKLGIFKSIWMEAPNGDSVEINYQDLSLITVNNQ